MQRDVIRLLTETSDTCGLESTPKQFLNGAREVCPFLRLMKVSEGKL
jgi:hypothetical protein